MCVFSETHASTHFNSTHSAVLVNLNNERRLPSNMIRASQCQMPTWAQGEQNVVTVLHVTIIHFIQTSMLTQSPGVKHLFCVCRHFNLCFKLKKAGEQTGKVGANRTRWRSPEPQTDTPSEQLAQQSFELPLFGFSLLAAWLSWSFLNGLLCPPSWATDHTLT